MQNTNEIFEFENVNGVAISLKMDSRKGSPKSQQFTIAYKNKEKKSSWPSVSLILAIFFNILAFSYVKISITTISIIIIVFAFLVFFWITHSVQSERLLVIPTVGIQSSVKYVFGREDNFVPWSSIDDIIINEVIKLNRVLYFLTVLVKTTNQTNDGESVKLLPLFKILPYFLYGYMTCVLLSMFNLIMSSWKTNNMTENQTDLVQLLQKVD